ncbi:hypothetical protein MP228_007330 [Amoeboaphelidium protococcarum]|nr:hypothetical protein MP228_007330 [Amoeboaphelidium protococcarum]
MPNLCQITAVQELPAGFEGAEKLLEVWFDGGADDTQSLRSICKEDWITLLKLVQCEILSHVSNEYVDAYLLSESSLFVFDRKIIIKTCGTTTLLLCLDLLLEYAKKFCGLSTVSYVFYSRKNFMFPENQPPPHCSWTDEVHCLENHFVGGAAYVVGKTNAQHHWYCFVWELPGCLTQSGAALIGLSPSSSQPSSRSVSPVGKVGPVADRTLEILMTGLSDDARQLFYPPSARRADGSLVASELLSQVFGEQQSGDEQQQKDHQLLVDDHLFDPCGYSCNGIMDEAYFDVHVTPEKHCSFASFETNYIPQRNGVTYEDIVQKVIQIFRPASFTVTLFSDRLDSTGYGKYNEQTLGAKIDTFTKKDRIHYEFEAYDLLYYHYESIEDHTHIQDVATK